MDRLSSNGSFTICPNHRPIYSKDALTDKSERFFVGEMIREKILLYYKQEIPYAVEVEIESFKEEAKTDPDQCAHICGKG